MRTKSETTYPRASWGEGLRILWAIISKDLLEAIKNKNTLAVLLTAIPMILVYYYLPVLESRNQPARVRIYNAGDSVLPALLENNAKLEVRSAPSEERMKWGLQQADTPELGLVIPTGFDQSVAAGENLILPGYVMSWFDAQQVQVLQQAIEAEIAGVLGSPVQIHLEGNLVYLEPDSGGLGVTGGLALVFVVTMVGLTLIPHLMLEEKTTRTIEALRVSPASAVHLVLGKAAVGLFYCLVGGGIALFVFQHLILHWWLALLVTALGALFTVALGLLLGNLTESRAQLTMWAWVVILPMFLPMFGILLEELIPDVLVRIFRLVPSSIMLNTLRISYVQVIPWGDTLLKLACLAAWVIGGLVLVVWIVRRQERSVPAESIIEPVTMPVLEAFARGGTRLFAPLMSRFSQARQLQPRQTAGAVTAKDYRKTGRAPASMPPSGLRLVWVIAAKDIQATIKNKLGLSIMLGSALMVFSNALPMLLLRTRDTPGIIVYDEGRSTIVRALGASDELRMGIVDSIQELQDEVATASGVFLGVVIPEDFDERAGSADALQLEGYVVHWADQQTVSRQTAFLEEQLGASVWGEVHINVEGHRVYPPAHLNGNTLMVALLFTVVVLTMGAALVPLLMVDERQAHTLEVLFVSPANKYHILAGKGLAGMFYCLLAAVVVLLLNQHLVVHWAVALLAVVLAGLFAVSIGLLIGVLSDNPTTVGIWGVLFLVVLIGISVLDVLANITWSPLVETFLNLAPTSAITELFGFALAGVFPLGQLWLNVVVLLLSVGLVFSLTLAAMRRMER